MGVVLCVYSHEIAETAGLLAHSFGEDEVDRYVMLFKKVCRDHLVLTMMYLSQEYAPSDEELQALRKGEVRKNYRTYLIVTL